jgi:hypothetical protein
VGNDQKDIGPPSSSIQAKHARRRRNVHNGLTDKWQDRRRE